MFVLLRLSGLEAADEAVEVPEAPGRPLTVGLTSRSVDLSWAPPFNSDSVPVNRYIIHIRPGEETDWKDSSVSVVETKNNETHYKVTGLSPFTTYSFRVTAVNARGKSKPSHESFYVFTLRESEFHRQIMSHPGGKIWRADAIGLITKNASPR